MASDPRDMRDPAKLGASLLHASLATRKPGRGKRTPLSATYDANAVALSGCPDYADEADPRTRYGYTYTRSDALPDPEAL